MMCTKFLTKLFKESILSNKVQKYKQKYICIYYYCVPCRLHFLRIFDQKLPDHQKVKGDDRLNFIECDDSYPH